MKKTLRYLISLLAYLLGVFALGKVAFMLYNHASADYSLMDVIQVWLHGVGMDASTTGYLLIVPWLCCLVAQWWKRMPLRCILMPYFLLMGLALTLTIATDIALYEYWQFKLDASIYNYLNANNGAAESMSTIFIIGCVAVLFGMTALIAIPAIRMTPRNLASTLPARKGSTVLLCLGVLLFVMIRGGLTGSPMNIGRAYYSDRLFLNHSAVNPTFSLGCSTMRIKPFNEQFRYYSPKDCDHIFADLYPTETEDVTDSLLTTRRPQILFIQLESFGFQFIEELGGHSNVTPNLSRYIQEGVLFDQVYANSFRTDRGTVSALSGHVSYPTATLMKYPEKMRGIPSLSRSLIAEGYSTTYVYGGDVSFMGKINYLTAAGYQHIVSEKDFTPEQIGNSKWGANDSVAASAVLQNILSRPVGADAPRWYINFQTIDSHEPFEVPYHRLDDKVLNAFAWTDHCMGMLLDSLKSTPVWDDLLVVMYADHGIMHEVTYENPEFFHIPVIMCGGAVREPRRFHTLMNQSDIVATLLSQMGISHRQYPWSRNVLSRNYTYPFAFSSYPGGALYADSTGISILDINAGKPIVGQSQPGAEKRIERVKVLLQKSYDKLHAM